ncbi:MAG: protein jag [Oscillospiraceae bacterium]|jgi:spoIIIJ-associated protein|nr:protein jag [Oscillospiraceae bacterium]
MKKTLRKSAKTEDEALRLALDELGLTRDDVSVEIVERAKSGFLGIGGSPAVLDVSYDAADEKTDKLRTFLEGLLSRFGVEASINISDVTDGSVDVTLETTVPGALIGRRGETLDSIQHLSNYVVNRSPGPYLRVNVDSEDYRRRKDEALEALAEKTAAKVVKNRRSITLDPMNAYERHVVHTALQENDQVSTYSIGSEPRRRIVIAFGKNAEAPRTDEEGPPHGRYRKPGRGPRAPRPESAHPAAPKEQSDAEYPENAEPEASYTRDEPAVAPAPAPISEADTSVREWK